MPSRTHKSVLASCSDVLLLAVCFYGAALACIYFSHLPNIAGTVWFSNAIAIAALVRSRRSRWPVLLTTVVACNFLAFLTTGVPVERGLVFLPVNLLEVLLATSLIHRLKVNDDFEFNIDSALRLIIFGAFVPAIISASAGAFILSTLHLRPFDLAWQRWYISDIVGLLALMPFALLCTRQRLRANLEPRIVLQNVGFLALSLVLTYISAGLLPLPYIYVVLPLLITAVRTDVFRTAFIGFCVALFICLLFALQVVRPFALGLENTPLLLLPIALVQIPPYLVAVVLEQNRREREKLALSEEVFRNAMEHSAIGMAIVSLEGRWVRVNNALCTMLGYSVAEFMGLTFQDITYPDDLAPDLALVEDILADRIKTYQLEKRYFRKDRGICWGLLAVSLVRDKDGAPLYFVSQIKDINDRKNAEEILRRDEARWNLALEGSNLGVWDWDLHSDEAVVSQEWLRLTHTEERFIKQAMQVRARFVHPEDLPSLNLDLDKLLRDETLYLSHEYRMLVGAHVKWVQERGQIIERTPEGKPSRMISTIADISERKERELEREIMSKRLALALKAGEIGVWEWDLDRGTVIWDGRMHDLYGIDTNSSPPDIGGWRRAVHPEDRQAAVERVERAVAQNSSLDTEFRIIRPDGEVRYVRGLGTIVQEGANNSRYMIGTNWDVTEHRVLTQTLHEEKERLRITLCSIADAVLTTDAEGRITFMNPVAETMTGWTLAEAAGKPHEDVFATLRSEDDALLPSPVTQCLQEQRVVELEEDATLISRDGARHDIENSAAPIRTINGEVVGAVLVFQNVTKSRTLQRELNFSATHDALTDLFNRTKFEQEIHRVFNDASASGNQHVLCFLDLDRFKVVNDSAGHGAGDVLLREVAKLLPRHVRSNDVVARLGGDEFALILVNCGTEKAEMIGEEIIADIKSIRFPWEGHIYDIGASIGIVAITQESPAVTELMSQADIACYAAKHAGRNRVSVYKAGHEDVEQQHRDILLASGLREALEENRFTLYAQEIVPTIPNDEGRHFELLIRMFDAKGGLVPPGAFIPAAERFNMMTDIDRWVVREVLVERCDTLLELGDVSFAINLSANSLSDPSFLIHLQELVRSSPMPAERLHFELTETALVTQIASAAKLLAQLREMGCKITLDDFGSGLSSFAYLKNFAVDYVKIDGVFVRNVDKNAVDAAIVESINEVAHRLGAKTVAEFVENDSIFAFVAGLGTDYAQGYGVCKPIPLDDLIGSLLPARVG